MKIHTEYAGLSAILMGDQQPLTTMAMVIAALRRGGLLLSGSAAFGADSSVISGG